MNKYTTNAFPPSPPLGIGDRCRFAPSKYILYCNTLNELKLITDILVVTCRT